MSKSMPKIPSSASLDRVLARCSTRFNIVNIAFAELTNKDVTDLRRVGATASRDEQVDSFAQMGYVFNRLDHAKFQSHPLVGRVFFIRDDLGSTVGYAICFDPIVLDDQGNLPAYAPEFEHEAGFWEELGALGSSAYLDQIVLIPTHRRRGLGVFLLRALEQYYISQGAKLLAGMIHAENYFSLRFFAHMDWRVIDFTRCQFKSHPFYTTHVCYWYRVCHLLDPTVLFSSRPSALDLQLITKLRFMRTLGLLNAALRDGEDSSASIVWAGWLLEDKDTDIHRTFRPTDFCEYQTVLQALATNRPQGQSWEQVRAAVSNAIKTVVDFYSLRDRGPEATSSIVPHIEADPHWLVLTDREIPTPSHLPYRAEVHRIDQPPAKLAEEMSHRYGGRVGSWMPWVNVYQALYRADQCVWNRKTDEHYWAHLIGVATKSAERATGAFLTVCFNGEASLDGRIGSILALGIDGLTGSIGDVVSRFKTRKGWALAHRAAAAAILARNMSHHIGSHVTPRTHLDDLRARVEELILPVFRGRETSRSAQRLLAPGWAWGGHVSGEPALGTEDLIEKLDRRDPPRRWQFDDWELKAFPILEELRDTLDDYVQRKTEFIAEFSTDPLISTRGASFYREVILPFIRNTALTDTLAANEGFRYVRDVEPGIVVRCFVAPLGKDEDGWRKAEEIRPLFHPERIAMDEEPGEHWRHPPYGMRFAGYPGRDILTDVHGARDPRVALPGPVGEMAFYGILENIIRNAAKHGARQTKKSEAKGTPNSDEWNLLEVHVVLRDEGPEEDCYRVRVYENLSGKPPKGKDKVLESLRKFAKKSIIDETGQARKEAWGTAEMALCAGVLRGVRPDSEDDHGLEVDAGRAVKPFVQGGDSNLRFVYSFKIRKACTAVFFGFDDVSEDVRETLKPLGFRFASASRLFDSENRELPPAFQFAVLDAEALRCIAAEENTDETARLAFKRLPFRVLVCGTSETRSDGISRALSAMRARPLSDTPPFGASEHDVEALDNWLWQSWLGGLTASHCSADAASVDLYFHQDARTQPTARWAASADKYNEKHKTDIPAPVVRVWARSGGALQCVTPKARALRSGEKRVVVDRHGMLVSHSQAYKPSSDDCIMVIDKSSSDFDALYNASFDAPWSLPYEIAEAGLLRILVIDERIAQRASSWYPAIEKGSDAFRMAMTNSKNEAPKLYHVAQRAGVFIATHVKIEGAGKNSGILDLACRDWRSQASTKSSSANWMRFKASATGHPGKDKGSIDVSFGRLPDLVVLHQGVVDLVRDRVGADMAKAFLERLSARCWTVIESGRGIPPEVQENGEKFLSFSLIEHAFHGKQVAKLGLVRQLMEVTRNRMT